MVEEIHTLETRQSQKALQREPNPNASDGRFPTSNSIPSENPSTSIQRVDENPLKRTRDELPSISFRNEEPLNLSYNSLSTQAHAGVSGGGGGGVGVGVSMGGGTNTGVSLTLGLHQDNRIGLSEPYPMHAAQRFGLGLEGNSEGYVLGGYSGSQNRHFGRDVMGGQIFHDFVG